MIHRPSRREWLCWGAAVAAGSLCHDGKFCGAAPATAANPWQCRFAICNETFGSWSHERVCAFVAECGYQGIEIAPYTVADDVRDISARTRADLRRVADEAGLEIVGLHWLLARTRDLHLTSPDPDTRRRTLDYLRDLAQLCADLGGRVLVFGSPQQRRLADGVTRGQGIDFACEILTKLVPTLDALNITLALEPLSSKATNFLTTAAEARELVDRVAAPQVALTLDCLAMSSESTPIPRIIQQQHHRLAHFHANDPNQQGPGFGQLDFAPIFATLQQIGYKGWISVEVFDYSPGPERLARASLEYMQSCLPRRATD
jgi:sugar phosphate isomerase/epimerase